MDAQDGIYYDTIADNLDGVIATFAIPYGQGGWPNPYRVSQQGGAYQSTPDFLAIVNEVTGQDLGWFSLDYVTHHSQMASHVIQHLKCAHDRLFNSDTLLTADVSHR